jgi:hypothetical protein
VFEKVADDNLTRRFVQSGQSFGFEGISHNQIIWHDVCAHLHRQLVNKAPHTLMKRETRIPGCPPGGIVMMLLSCVAMGANAATIVQTEEFSFLPYAMRTLAFDKFDDSGGNATLTGVHITIQYTRSGGYAAYDNESESSATITLTNSVSLIIDTREVLDLTEMGSSSRLGGFTGLKATSSVSATFGTDDDPLDSNFNSSGADHYRYDLPDVTVGDAAHMNNISQFIGTDSFELELEGSQTDQSQLMSGMKSSTSPPSVSGFMTITYEYTETPDTVPDPDPSTMVCIGMIWALFVRRRSY